MSRRIWALISLSFGVPLASVNNFLPQIVASLGYSTVKTNLYTVAPNIVGTVAVIALSFSSDYCRERSIHMWVLIERVKHNHKHQSTDVFR